MSDPLKPSGSSAQARWAQAVHDKAFQSDRLSRVSGHRVANTGHGKLIVPSRATGGGGSTVALYRIRIVYEDYYVCRDWDGTTLGTEDVLVAKPHILRATAETLKVYAAGVWSDEDLTYDDDTEDPFMAFESGWGEDSSEYDADGDLFQLRLNPLRTVTSGSDSEQQQVIPYYWKGQEIYAASTDNTGVTVDGNELDLIEILPARHWMAIG